MTDFNVVGADRLDVDGVLEPLARGDPTDIVAAAGILGEPHIHRIGTIGTGFVGDAGVVIGDRFAAQVVVFGLDGAGTTKGVPK